MVKYKTVVWYKTPRGATKEVFTTARLAHLGGFIVRMCAKKDVIEITVQKERNNES